MSDDKRPTREQVLECEREVKEKWGMAGTHHDYLMFVIEIMDERGYIRKDELEEAREKYQATLNDEDNPSWRDEARTAAEYIALLEAERKGE
jgi:hypothetical protein